MDGRAVRVWAGVLLLVVFFAAVVEAAAFRFGVCAWATGWRVLDAGVAEVLPAGIALRLVVVRPLLDDCSALVDGATEGLLLKSWRDFSTGVAGCNPSCPDFLTAITVLGVLLRDFACVSDWTAKSLSLDFWLANWDCWSCVRASLHRWPD